MKYNFNLVFEEENYRLYEIFEGDDKIIPISSITVEGDKKNYTVNLKNDSTVVAKFEKEGGSIFTTFFDDNGLHCAIEKFLKSQDITIMLA